MKCSKACDMPVQFILGTWACKAVVTTSQSINWCARFTLSPRRNLRSHGSHVPLPVFTSLRTRPNFHLLPETNHPIKRKP